MTITSFSTNPESGAVVAAGWSVDEDASPHYPGAPSSATPQFTAEVRTGIDPEWLIGTEATFDHSDLGITSDLIVTSSTVSGTNEDSNLTVSNSLDTPLGLLVAERDMPPISTLDYDRVRYDLGMPGGSAGRFVGVDIGGSPRRLIVARANMVTSYILGTSGGATTYMWNQSVWTVSTVNRPIADVVYSSFNDNIYVLASESPSTSTVYRVNPATGAIIASYNIPIFGGGIGVNQSNGQIYITDRATNSLVVYAATSFGVPLISFPIPGTVRGVALNSTTVFVGSEGLIYKYNIVTGSSEGTLSIPFSLSRGGSRLVTGLKHRDGVLTAYGASDATTTTVDGYGFLVTFRVGDPNPLGFITSVPGEASAFELLAPVAGVYDSVGGRVVVLDTLDPAAGYGVNGYAAYTYPWDLRLSGVFQRYVQSVTPALTLTWNALTDPVVVLPGWIDSVWNVLNQLCAQFGVEITYNGTNITVEDVGSRVLSLDNTSAQGTTLSLDVNAAGKSVTFYNFNTEVKADVVYTADQTFQIGVDEVQNVRITLDHFLTSVTNPVYTDSGDIGPGQYTVSSSDGTRIPAAYWTGSVSARVDPDDSQVLILTFQGPSAAIPIYTRPYKFEYVTASGRSESSLNVVGQGVFSYPKDKVVPTSASPLYTGRENAMNVTNIAHISDAEIYRNCSWTIQQASGPSITLSTSVPTHELQGYGITAGSVVSFKEAKYRIMNVGIASTWSSITAQWFVTAEELETLWGSDTWDQVEAYWGTKTYVQMKSKILREIP